VFHVLGMVVPSNFSTMYAPPGRTSLTRKGPIHLGDSLCSTSVRCALLKTKSLTLKSRGITLVRYLRSTRYFVASPVILASSRTSSKVSKLARSPCSFDSNVSSLLFSAGFPISIGSSASVPYTRLNGVSWVVDYGDLLGPR